MHNLRRVISFAIKDSNSELKIIFRNRYRFINHLTICNQVEEISGARRCCQDAGIRAVDQIKYLKTSI